jgi:hypothetical protein
MKLQNIIEIYDVGIINDFKESKWRWNDYFLKIDEREFE